MEIYIPATHLPSKDTKRIHVAGFRTFSPNKSEALRINQLGGRAVEKSINVHHRHGGRSRNCSKAGDADVSATVNEDVCLDKCEPMTRVWGRGMFVQS